MNNLVVLVLLLVVVCHGANKSRAHTDVQRSSSSSSDCQLYGAFEGSADITMWRNGLALHVTPTTPTRLLAEYARGYG